eukprot:TRINITY_DN14577_c0_g1_i7.p1 TRINITY_DN14577_c0_g1~~TRINITY_DN14577_c0_g1_i7.p1  ORF type:complete len:178 (+),score=49.02 TRINITY_DN14577_c0_g1_i7:33-536(+)
MGVPNHIRTYVHRVGRTARAGKQGIACSLLLHQEVRWFKEMLSQAEQNHVSSKHFARKKLKPVFDKYRRVLAALKLVVKWEEKHKFSVQSPIPAARLQTLHEMFPMLAQPTAWDDVVQQSESKEEEEKTEGKDENEAEEQLEDDVPDVDVDTDTESEASDNENDDAK